VAWREASPFRFQPTFGMDWLQRLSKACSRHRYFFKFFLSHKIAAMLDIFFFLLLLFWEASKACSRHRYFFEFILSHEIAAMLDIFFCLL